MFTSLHTCLFRGKDMVGGEGHRVQNAHYDDHLLAVVSAMAAD
jgi:hypothetical protein